MKPLFLIYTKNLSFMLRFFWVNKTISEPDYTDNDEYESLTALLDLIEKVLINSRDFITSRHTLHSSYN